MECKVGEGTIENPYIITNAEELNGIRDNLSACYKLEADIDMEGAEYTPVGTDSTSSFSGVLDGGNHVIRNLKVSGSNNVGLIGYGIGATICNVRLENAEVTATGNYAGVIAGYLSGGSIERCGVSGKVNGYRYTGGLAGHLGGGAKVSNSYAMGEVSGSNAVYTSGLVAYTNGAVIRNSYAACKVSSGGKGLVYVYDPYNNQNTTVEDSYYDSQVAGFGTQDRYNQGKLTSAFLRKSFFKNWDFEDIWGIVEGKTYPYLRGEGSTGVEADPGEITGGAGTEEAPYQIGTAGGFGYMKHDLSGEYLLVSDIDMEGAEYTPVGTDSTSSFSGVLDGGNHVIRNLKVSGSNNVGLIGYGIGATICNVRLENAEVTATGNYAGVVAGYLSGGSMIRCSAEGSVTGNQYVGGLIGDCYGTGSRTMENCMKGNVTGRQYVGGLAGRLQGTVKNSYAVADVISTSSNRYAAGLIGYADTATIQNCYAAGQVSSNASGLVYIYRSTTVQDSFFDSDKAKVITPSDQARTTEQMWNRENYAEWDMERVWSHEANNYPVLKLIDLSEPDFFELEALHKTWFSVIIRWPGISSAEEYEISYLDKVEKQVEPELLIDNLTPDTEYEFRMKAKIDEFTTIQSDTLKIRTRKMGFFQGVHCVEKGENFILVTWDPTEDAVCYEVHYNDSIVTTDTNECRLAGLSVDTPYILRIKAMLNDGGQMMSAPIVVKLYNLQPQTDYAREFITKCEEQTWFMDEIESLLNRRGKSISTLQSANDFITIYALCLTDRSISGKVPAAIGELSQLRYLYLDGNDLDEVMPEELGSLEHLIETII